MMRIVIRIYKWHDSDIMALREFGISWPRLLKLALSNYAEGKRIKYSIPELAVQVPSAVRSNHAISSGSSARFSVDIKDANSLKILEKVKSMRRNEFCKAIMRDALICKPLESFFTEEEYISHALSVRQSPAIITTSSLTDLCPVNSAEKKTKEKNKDKKTSSKRRKTNKENMGSLPSDSVQPQTPDTSTELSEAAIKSSGNSTPSANRPPSNTPSNAPSAVRRPMEAVFPEEAADIPVFDMGSDFEAPVQHPVSEEPAVDIHSLFSNMLDEVDNT